MRSGLVALAALLFTTTPALAADPPIVFQVQPVGQVLDELRAAGGIVAGEKGTKAVNKIVKSIFGEKGLEGFDINRPVVGYVILAPKPEDITAVIALPISGEKEFLTLCDRVNRDKVKVDEKDKTLYHLPPLDPRYKALMRFSNQYAYIAYGFNPAQHIEAKALIPLGDLYDPAERGLIAGRMYFDRIPAAVKLAAPKLFEEVKKNIIRGFWLDESHPVIKAVIPEFEKLAARYLKLSAGADVLTARLYLDQQAHNFVAEAVLTSKPQSELSKLIADYKPTPNKFGSITAHPDTVVGFKTRLPLFAPDMQSAVVAGLEAGQKIVVVDTPQAGKAAVEELFKGLIRTTKTGEFDIALAARGPNKDGWFTMVGAVAFEDSAALEKEFKKFVAAAAPQDIIDAIKWDAAKAGNVNIHTWNMKQGGFIDPSKVFGGGECLTSFAFAPHGIYAAMGPDSVKVLQDTIAAKPAASPVLDVVLNPARMRKLIEKSIQEDRDPDKIVDLFGNEDKLGSVASLTVEGGKELKAKLVLDLRVLPRLMFQRDIQRAARDDEKPTPEDRSAPADPVKKPR
jgi:hypothetical protein